MDKSVKLFLLVNVLLGIPAWLLLLVGHPPIQLKLFYIVLWHLPAIFILNKKIYSKKTVVALCYLSIVVITLAFVFSVAVVGPWMSILSVTMCLSGVLAYLKIQFLRSLMHYASSNELGNRYS